MTFRPMKSDTEMAVLEFDEEPLHIPEEGDWVGFMHKSGQYVQGQIKARCFNYRVSNHAGEQLWKEVIFRVHFKFGKVDF